MRPAARLERKAPALDRDGDQLADGAGGAELVQGGELDPLRYDRTRVAYCCLGSDDSADSDSAGLL